MKIDWREHRKEGSKKWRKNDWLTKKQVWVNRASWLTDELTFKPSPWSPDEILRLSQWDLRWLWCNQCDFVWVTQSEWLWGCPLGMAGISPISDTSPQNWQRMPVANSKCRRQVWRCLMEGLQTRHYSQTRRHNYIEHLVNCGIKDKSQVICKSLQWWSDRGWEMGAITRFSYSSPKCQYIIKTCF